MVGTPAMPHKARIVIADDASMILDLEEILLERTGCEIVRASNGAEALKKIETVRPTVVILDLMMPGLSGEAVCKFIKNDPRLKGTRVLIVTSKADRDNEERCYRAGADYFLAKPIDRGEFLNRVNACLGR